MSNTGIIERALSSLGKGFDLTSDFRLKFCKGKERIVLLNEAETNELVLPGFGVFKDVSVDIKCDKGDRTRYQSDILEFHQMSEFFNQKSRIAGKIPSGLFNAWFGFEAGSWGRDAENTKYLGIDGYFIIQFNFHIDRFPLVLSDHVLNAVPSSWNPSALARFIEKYGTHVIVGLSIGGHDVVLVRQAKSSKLAPSELKKYLNDLGDQLFTGSCNFSPKTKEQNKLKIPQAFNVFDPQPVSFNSYSTINTKDGITVICHKKGGDLSTNTHAEWLPTVSRNPDAVHFNFIPITSLLKNVPGKGFLSHAINLYLRYKPPISDLESFLDFQYHKIWAPIHSDLPLGPTSNISSASPALRFSMMGPKLHINTSQVVVGKKPIAGMRFYLEGMRCNRLAIHLQHLANTPKMLENKIIGDPTQIWRGSEETYETGFYEPVQWKKFSHICTAPIESDLRWSNTSTNNKSYIVTGAQLHVQKHNSKRVLHLRLLFSRVSHSYEVQSTWTQSSSEFSQKSGLFSAISTSISGNPNKNKVTEKKAEVDSSVFPSGPPVPVQTQKLLKYVDTSQICRGPQDSPGHWLVTGAKLDLDKGKICLQVKFSLLAICS